MPSPFPSRKDSCRITLHEIHSEKLLESENRLSTSPPIFNSSPRGRNFCSELPSHSYLCQGWEEGLKKRPSPSSEATAFMFSLVRRATTSYKQECVGHFLLHLLSGAWRGLSSLLPDSPAVLQEAAWTDLEEADSAVFLTPSASLSHRPRSTQAI